jgi:hypothetical protein
MVQSLVIMLFNLSFNFHFTYNVVVRVRVQVWTEALQVTSMSSPGTVTAQT